MANNFRVNVYQINQQDIALRDAPYNIGFPTTQVIIRDNINSPTRSLPTGYNVYSFIQDVLGNKYYVAETIAQLSTLVG